MNRENAKSKTKIPANFFETIGTNHLFCECDISPTLRAFKYPARSSGKKLKTKKKEKLVLVAVSEVAGHQEDYSQHEVQQY